MSEIATFRLRGLNLSANEHTQPEGSLAVADNVVVTKDDVVEPRRGFEKVATKADLVSLFNYRDKMYGYGGGAFRLASDDLTTWNDVLAVAPPAAYRMRTAQQNGNLYLTSANGILRMEGTGAVPVQAGVSPALSVSLALSDGVGTALDPGEWIGYRVVWGTRDANGNLILGAPSPRVVIENTDAGKKDVTITFSVPADITTSHFWQLYRTAAAATSDEVGDEMTLVQETAFVSGATVSYTDNLPGNLFGGVALYTNETQRGATAAQYPPPKAKDIAAFKNCLFFANCEDKASASIQLLTTDGGATGQVIVVGGFMYTANAVEDAATQKFAWKLASDYTPANTVKAIQDTVASLIRVVNAQAASTVIATDTSDPDGVPGHVLFTAKQFGQTVYPVPSTRTTWIVDPKTAVQGKNELRWSAPLQPDAVPLLNYVRIGSADKEIIRIVPTRDSLFVFKEDGVWRVTGESGVWDVSPFDPTVRLIAPDSPAVLDNAVWCLSTQGVVRITESGTGVVSRPIDPILGPAIAKFVEQTVVTFGNVAYKQTIFAIGRETEHLYMLWLPVDETDKESTEAYVYNLFTETWTRRTDPARCALVDPTTDKLLKATTGGVYRERRSYDDSDYLDDDQPIPFAVKWPVAAPGGPGTLKHWQEAVFHFKTGTTVDATVSFETEFNEVEVTGKATSVLGAELPAALPAFLGQASRANMRLYVPLETSRSSVIQIGFRGETTTAFAFQGLTLKFNVASGRVA